jgi:cell envelope opacity-associated protein A
LAALLFAAAVIGGFVLALTRGFHVPETGGSKDRPAVENTAVSEVQAFTQGPSVSQTPSAQQPGQQQPVQSPAVQQQPVQPSAVQQQPVQPSVTPAQPPQGAPAQPQFTRLLHEGGEKTRKK